jgi:DNA-binding NarL/FixJ family response regulator
VRRRAPHGLTRLQGAARLGRGLRETFPRLLIVDDHEIVRQGLVVALEAARCVEIVGVAGTGAEAITIARRSLPQLALVDVRLPDLDGRELCARLLALLPSLSIVVLTSDSGEDTARELLAAGAVAFVTKSAGLAAILSTVAGVVDGAITHERPRRILSPSSSAAMPTGASASRLVSVHQERLLELAAQGLSNRAIGARLCVSESTVRFHLQNLKAKFGASTLAELLAIASGVGAIAPGPEHLVGTA